MVAFIKKEMQLQLGNKVCRMSIALRTGLPDGMFSNQKSKFG
jgi:hypothetical protein